MLEEAPVLPIIVTSTVSQFVPAGTIAVIDVEELITKLKAFTPPNWTVVTPLNPVPVIVTELLPEVGPVFGLMLINVGAAIP